MMIMHHFLDLFGVSEEDIQKLLKDAARLKKAHERGQNKPLLQGRVLGMIFEKPSLRTRVSFQAAMAQLGGDSIFMAGGEVGLGVRESIPDFARTISNYVDAVVLRTFHHKTVEDFAAHSSCPVINGLSDYCHPCQALGDLLTIKEVFKDIKGRSIVFVGDGNNVARSLAIGCGKLGARFVLACPDDYGFDQPFLDNYRRFVPEGVLEQTSDPAEVLARADIIYTDVWTSMGQETEREERRKKFASFQLNAARFNLAPSHARLMHCLPAHRGEEVTDDVLDGERSIVFQQAGNRMHAQKALLIWLLKSAK
jgi:ornithine carbamoyltransferase